ncbi:MAG: putative DNA-binding domain-containing protein [Xanthomonadaceae bacterium]|nr:putative DNA-binding domain-containing protein [Xanthomonadaceae bacterium]
MTFRADQFTFAAHLRDPKTNPPPAGVDPSRLRVYRALFFNNVYTFLRNAFPVARKTLGDAAFRKLVRAWYAEHRAQTPLFPRLPGEFAAWLAAEPDAAATLPAWLPELAAYEWLETELDHASGEVDLPGVDPAGDVVRGIPVLSPIALAVQYTWPVHLIGPGFKPNRPPPQPTTLLVYRDRADRVRFMETNQVTHQLLLLIASDEGHTGKELLDAIAQALPQADPTAVRRAGRKMLITLRDFDAISGARPPPR